MQGSSGELREIAAEGLGELVEVTSQESLRPFTVQITGEGNTHAHPRPLTLATAVWQQIEWKLSPPDCHCQVDRAQSLVVAAGPLIRIIGDRFAWQVKAAILHTLGLLIGKAGPGLKPFVPQLQTTFLKCLSDQVTHSLLLSMHCVPGIIRLYLQVIMRLERESFTRHSVGTSSPPERCIESWAAHKDEHAS